MTKIDTGGWKEFHLYDIFDIDAGNKMDRGKMSDGNIAFVGRTANNNGINARVGSVVGHEKYGTVHPYQKGCITLALGGSIGSCFVQEEPFYTSQNVAVLMPKNEQSVYVLRFIASVISHSVLYGKYKAFTEELNKHIKTDFVISLPVTSEGNPDFEFMDMYMQDIMKESETSLENLRRADKSKTVVDTSGWKAFQIGDLFDVVKGTRLTKANMKPGDNRFIGSSAMNNGVTAMISNDDNIHPANTLTVCYNGSVGETFYQDKPFLASDDVNVLYPKFEMNVFIGLFIVPIIKAISTKYTFIDKWKQEVMISDTIKLPATSDGKPDYAYMDQYMCNVLKSSEECLERLKVTH